MDKSGESKYFELSIRESEFLRAYAIQKGVTMFEILSGLFGLTLSKYLTESKFLVSYSVNTRPRKYRDAVGCFVNTIPMKFDFGKVENIVDLIKFLKNQRKSLHHHQTIRRRVLFKIKEILVELSTVISIM